MNALVLRLALGLLAATFALPIASEGEQRAGAPVIGRLHPGAGAHPLAKAGMEGFRQGLREHGRIEGQSIRIEHRFAEGSLERLQDFAAELVRLRVDVIVAVGTPAIRAAKQATRTIPIVMAASGAEDPVEAGFITSLARPGGNITGLSLMIPELTGKRLELLKEAVPGADRIGVLANAASPVTARQWKETEVAARVLGVGLVAPEVRGPKDLDGAFQAMTRDGARALFVYTDPLMLDSHPGQIVALALKHRLPAIYPWRAYAETGGLISYGPNTGDVHRRAATYVDKILKGAKPADLPVEQPTKFELIINLKTARALGLTIPPSVMIRADQVIQ